MLRKRIKEHKLVIVTTVNNSCTILIILQNNVELTLNFA